MRVLRLACLAWAMVGPFDRAAAAESEPAVGEVRAQISPRRFTTLSAEIAGKVEEITVKEGDHFSAGQILLRIDCALHQANFDKARATLSGAEKTLEVNRSLRRLRAGGTLETELAAVEVAKAEADVRATSAIVGKCVIVAPYAGRLADLKIREQQFVQAATPLFEIIDDDVFQVEFLAPSRWLTFLAPGAAFEIEVDETGRTYPAHVVRLGARVDPVSQSIRVIGELAGRQPDLIAGMSGKVVLTPKR
ncbi:efflux RND transporter periplasmic adaptor subunit [Siculibacillus lacustris]|nr:efflux RND transporter periplasmic adaptor subunit [Siculibacillus lacustris]